MPDSMDGITSKAKTNLEAWHKVFSLLEELGFESSTDLPQSGKSITLIDEEIVARLELVSSAQPLPSASERIIPQSQLKSLESGLANLESHIVALQAGAKAVQSAGGASFL